MMRRRSRERTAKLVTAVIALAAAALALYVQLFEVRARQEESRLASLRLESALAESRSRLKAEIVAELRADAARSGSALPGNGPHPGTVLRRPESEESAPGALSPALEPSLPAPPLTLSGLAQGLEALAQQTRESDRSLRRDLEEFRAATRRELDAGAKATVLTLVALISLAVYLLLSYFLAEPAAAPGQSAAPGAP
jgi:hypothetical protein